MKKGFILTFLMLIPLILFLITCTVSQETPADNENDSSVSSSSVSSSVSSSSISSSESTTVSDMDLWVEVFPVDDNTTGSVIYWAHAHMVRDSDENTALFNNAVITVNGVTLAFDTSYGENGRFSYEGSGLVLTTGNNVTFIVSHPAITTLNFTLTVPQFVTTLNTSVSIDAYQAQATPTNLTLSWNSAVCDYYCPVIWMNWEDMSSGFGYYITETSRLYGPEDIEDDPEEGAPDYISFEVETYNEIWDINSNGMYYFSVRSHHTPYISNEPAGATALDNIVKSNSALKSSKSVKRTIKNRPDRVRK